MIALDPAAQSVGRFFPSKRDGRLQGYFFTRRMSLFSNKWMAGLVLGIGAWKLYQDLSAKKPLTSVDTLTDAALVGAGVKLFF